jgi:hypothetical protein
LEKVGSADDSENEADGQREAVASRVVDQSGGGKAIFCAAGFELGAASGQDILNPLALGAVSEGDKKTLRGRGRR